MYTQTFTEDSLVPHCLSVNIVEQPASDISTLSQKLSDDCKATLQLDVPVDFLTYSAAAMVRLKKSRRSNVVYNLSKGIGQERADSSESRFPVSRMPMGLFEYVTNFYVAEDINEVSICTLMIQLSEYIYPCRFLPVLKIIGHGYKLCTLTLARNGQDCIMGPCGALLAPVN